MTTTFAQLHQIHNSLVDFIGLTRADRFGDGILFTYQDGRENFVQIPLDKVDELWEEFLKLINWYK